ncbi:Trace amine-associated receptor 7d [Exaiptasia diaphana]|nr:Trace amine-associated receptor 7d [Exaiptasia diaphana]
MEWRTALNTSNNSFSQTSQEGCFYFEVNLSTESYWEIIHTITAAINSIFAISSVLGNSLILYVIWKNPSLHNPSNTLLGCLAFSDFFVGFLAQPAFVAHKIGELTSNFPLYCKTRVATETVGMITSGVSILTLAAISIERYLALKLNLRYKALVTISRMLYTVGSFWVIMSLVTALKILPNMKTASDTIIFAILVASFILILVSYAKILRCVIRHQNAINSEQVFVQSERNIEDLKDEKTEKVQRTFSLLRYKKSTISMAYILGFYLIFYMPFIVTLVAKKFVGYTRREKGRELSLPRS